MNKRPGPPTGELVSETGPVVFRAFREKEKSHWPRWALLATPFAALFVWLVAQEVASPRLLLMLPGYHRVSQGMTLEEVRGVLGHPIAAERLQGRDCYRYGRPSLELPVFPIYSLCYEDGKLEDVKVRYYTPWRVDPEDLPAPPPPGEAP